MLATLKFFSLFTVAYSLWTSSEVVDNIQLTIEHSEPVWTAELTW